MKFLFLSLTALCVCIINSVVSQGDISCVPFSTAPGSALRCGGVIQDFNGTVFYKPYERVVPNERCVWSLFPPQIGSSREIEYEIHVLYMGFLASPGGSGPRLLFTGIGLNDTILENQVTLTGTGMFKLPLLTRSAMFTFSSGDFDPGSTDYTGFILQYSSKDEPYFVNYADHTISLPPVKFNYQKQVSVGMVSSLIIPPPSNFYNGEEGYPLIYLENGDAESSDLAAVSVYHYHFTSLAQPWKLVDEVGKGNDTKVLQGHNDIQLFVLRATTPANFALFHMRCNEE